jgi:4-hydroxy-3-methylbut-2-enyl diphosphate reductase IspH
MTLVETVEDVARLAPAEPDNLAFLTQTTLSVDDTAMIVEALHRRFPGIRARAAKTSAMRRPTARRRSRRLPASASGCW